LKKITVLMKIWKKSQLSRNDDDLFLQVGDNDDGIMILILFLITLFAH